MDLRTVQRGQHSGREFRKSSIDSGVRFTPLARRLIALNRLDAERIAAKALAEGRNKIARNDVLAALDVARAVSTGLREEVVSLKADIAPAGAQSIPTPIRAIDGGKPSSDAVQIVPLNRIRQVTARHVSRSWQTTPHVLQAVEVVFDRIASVRAASKQQFEAIHGVALTYMPFIARAVSLAIVAFPHINARLDGEQLLVFHDLHLGIAVDLDHNGLVVPVIRHADQMNVTELAKAIDRQVAKARSGRLAPDDLEGGTYSISNNGSFGTLLTAPIINSPQVAILSTDAIRKRAVVVETEHGDVVVPRLVGILAQSFDHRAFDGAYSAGYLQQLKTIIETRDWAAELH